MQAAPKGLGAPAQRRYHRKSIFDFPIDKPFVWVVSLAIHAGREVGSDVHRRLPRALGPVHGRWLVDVVQSDGQQPAERDGWVRHAMGGAGDVAEEPHAIVELSGLTHRPKQTVDRIDAADLCNQAVDASCDPGTSVIVKVRAESANRDGITALAEAAAGGPDVELPVHSAPPQAIGCRRRRPRHGPPDGVEPLFAMRQWNVAADFGRQVPDDGFENTIARLRDVASGAGNSERFSKPGTFGAMQMTVGIAFCTERGIGTWTLLTKVETSCDRILIAGGANVEAEWEQGPAV